MNITRDLPFRPLSCDPVLTIGNFDGQHLGHQALVRKVVERAGQIGGVPMVLTFDPHPIEVLRPGSFHKYLSDDSEREAFFARLGIAELIVLSFTVELASMLPAEFVEKVLRKGLGIRKLLVGENFVFGKGRSGNIHALTSLGEKSDFTVEPIPPIVLGSDIVSSTRIRRCLGNGNVLEAAQCLGRPYRLRGPVIPGAGRGAKLGWPTANIRPSLHRVFPADGIYATRTMVDGEARHSISYIGSRPTFQENERFLEVHIFDQNISLYGKVVTVEFIDYVRSDQAFTSVEALLAQMERDGERARTILANSELIGSLIGENSC